MKKQLTNNSTNQFSDADIISIKLAAHTAPLIEEVKNQEYPYVLFSVDSSGKDRHKWRNQYPQYLIYLLNRSSKHNAIVTSKAQYIAGKGFNSSNELADLQEKKTIAEMLKRINLYESANTVLAKIAYDLELFNGFALEIISDKTKGKWVEIYHSDFSKWRSNEDGSEFYFTSDWSSWHPEDNSDWRILPAYNPDKPAVKQLLYFKGYRPNLDVYPFPEYIGALPYIECDYEIANFHLNNLKNGFVGGTIVSLNNGTPKLQNQKEIEEKIKRKFSGTDNAGQLILVFSDGKDKEPTILHLTPSEMDKQFNLLNETVQQEIFTAHRITSPLLFGIRTEGQLGGRNELADAWELFQSNYISYKQNIIEEIFNDLLEDRHLPRTLSILRTEPVGIGLSDEIIAQYMSPNEIRERAGLPALLSAEMKELPIFNTKTKV